MEANLTEDIPKGLSESENEGWGDYPLDTVFVRSERRTIKEVMDRIGKNRYILDPDFQREFVWDRGKQSRLIESCLMRIPLPVFYVAENEDGRIVVVDGLQRLTTFYRYTNDEFYLSGLASRDATYSIDKKLFSELPVKLQERIEDTQLTLYILDAKAPERARLDIFERVNSGVALTRQQMRNSLYSGPATRLLKKLSVSDEFTTATGESLNQKTMRDRELINRFCGFYVLGHERYRGEMDEFLAGALKEMNALEASKLDEIESSFRASMQTNRSIFGWHAFRKSIAGGPTAYKTVINASLFDVLSVAFAKYAMGVADEPAEIKAQIVALLSDEDFSQAISYSTNSSKNVRIRFEMVDSVFGEVFGDR